MSMDEALDLLSASLVHEHGTYTRQDLRDALNTNAATLWTGAESAAFVSISDYEHGGARVCEISPVGGNLTEILNVARPELETYARAMGCTQIHIEASRPGWSRVLAPYGYEQAAVLLRKLL